MAANAYCTSSSIKHFSASSCCWHTPEKVSSASFSKEERYFTSTAPGAAPPISSCTSSRLSLDSIPLTSAARSWICFCLYSPTSSPISKDLADCFQNSWPSFAEMGIRLSAISSICSRMSWSEGEAFLFRAASASQPKRFLSWKSTITTRSSSRRRVLLHNSPFISIQNSPICDTDNRVGIRMAELFPEPLPPITRACPSVYLTPSIGLHRYFVCLEIVPISVFPNTTPSGASNRNPSLTFGYIACIFSGLSYWVGLSWKVSSMPNSVLPAALCLWFSDHT